MESFYVREIITKYFHLKDKCIVVLEIGEILGVILLEDFK